MPPTSTLLFATGAAPGRVKETDENRALLIERLANDAYKMYVDTVGSKTFVNRCVWRSLLENRLLLLVVQKRKNAVPLFCLFGIKP